MAVIVDDATQFPWGEWSRPRNVVGTRDDDQITLVGASPEASGLSGRVDSGDGYDTLTIDGGWLGNPNLDQLSVTNVEKLVLNTDVLASIQMLNGFQRIEAHGLIFASGAGTLDLSSKQESIGYSVYGVQPGSTVIGSEHADELSGGDALYGMGGNDWLQGPGRLFGGDGDDFLDGGSYMDGGAGDDLISTRSNGQAYGGAGDDRFWVFGRTATVDGGEGYDSVDVGGHVEDVMFENIETLNVSNHVWMKTAQLNEFDTISFIDDSRLTLIDRGSVDLSAKIISPTSEIAASDFGNMILLGQSSDLVIGGLASDTIHGGSGDDRLYGGGGADLIDGGEGGDVLVGGTGDDTIIVDNERDVVVESTNEGHDVVRSSVTFALTNNVEDLVLTGSDKISAIGNKLDNVLIGNASNNSLFGGAGNDTLQGGGGADRLIGGAGVDRLTGGSGADVFIFADGSSGRNGYVADRITDFSSRQGDWIDLSAIDADVNSAGAQFFTVVSSLAEAKTAGSLALANNYGYYQVTADTNGDGEADFMLLVDTQQGSPLTISDFILIPGY